MFTFRRVSSLWAARVAIFAPLVCVAGNALGVEEETLETIFAAWRKRETAIKSVELVIAEDCTIGKGSHARGEPPHDFESRKQILLVIDGGEMRVMERSAA